MAKADSAIVTRWRRISALFLVGLALAVGLAACGSSSGGREGGTLKATYSSFPDSLDPALAFSPESWTALYNTYIPLLTYAHANGEEGSKVIPGLAKALPEISNGGKRYTLFMRKGLRYSDGTPVKASDFPFAVERMFKLNSGGSSFYTDIVGAEEFAESKQGGISGIQADDASGKIVIDLVNPRGSFENELGLPFVAPVPASTPEKDLTGDPPPATGPYAITQSQPGKGWEYGRNPQWAKANAKLIPEIPSGSMNKIDVTVLRNSSTQVNDIESGKLDWMENAPPADRYAEVKNKFEGTQFRIEPTISTYFFWLNTTEAPFDDVKVRQAVNYAVNPEALERIYAGQLIGTQQILPPGMPGYKQYELYPYDIDKAKELIAEANPSDREITVWTDTESPNNEAGEYYEGVLKELGFDVNLKIVNVDNYYPIVGNATTPDLDTGWAAWFQDYPHPNDFFQPLLSEESIFPTESINLARFANPRLSAKIDTLAEKPLDPQVEGEYAELDQEFMEEAPWVPYGNSTYPTFVSSAIDLDKVVFNPTFSQDLTSFQFK